MTTTLRIRHPALAVTVAAAGLLASPAPAHATTGDPSGGAGFIQADNLPNNTRFMFQIW
ncbi:hypothetical protein [Dactylosporangium sp. NPDC000521]|uniref:hypothetical protein n=1 Tax=Dactylosporangium sp. NPDC000521 TaxID=3363975 RepID=UPI00369A5716